MVTRFAFAQTTGAGSAATSTGGGSGGVLNTFVVSAGNYISKNIIPILVAIAVFVFFYNLIFFIFNSDNEAERQKFKKYSLNSILALFIMLCVWGIVGIFTNTFFNKTPVIPQLPTSDATTSAKP